MFVTTRRVLLHERGGAGQPTYFTTMFSAGPRGTPRFQRATEQCAALGDEGAWSIRERDPGTFALILRYLETGVVPRGLTHEQRSLLVQEAEALSLGGLLRRLQEEKVDLSRHQVEFICSFPEVPLHLAGANLARSDLSGLTRRFGDEEDLHLTRSPGRDQGLQVRLERSRPQARRPDGSDAAGVQLLSWQSLDGRLGVSRPVLVGLEIR